MIWKIKFFICILILTACNGPREQSEALSDTSLGQYHSTKHLIEAEELSAISQKPMTKVIDFRRSTEYEKGHIPGAIQLWRDDIESHSYPYKGMMVSKDSLELLLSYRGIRNGDLLIVYDDAGSCDAARFWWVLKNHSYQNIKILNGGLNAWKNVGGVISNSEPAIKLSKFKFNSQSQKTSITSDELTNLLASKTDFLLLDTRTADEFSGKRQKKGATFGGRIFGAHHLDWVENINFDGDGKFRSFEELNKLYHPIAESKNEAIVTYCQTGVRSSLTYFVLTELLGYTNVRNYDGSWAEWSFKGLPSQSDSLTVIME